MKRLAGKHTLLFLVGGLYLLGILAPAGILGGILISSLERERSARFEKRLLERKDAAETLRKAVHQEIEILRRRQCDPGGALGSLLAGFWNESPAGGLIRITPDQRLLPFEIDRPESTAGDEALVLGSGEYLAGLKAEQAGDLVEAPVRYRRALQEPGGDAPVVRIALARVLLRLRKVRKAAEALRAADLGRPEVNPLVALEGYALLREAYEKSGNADAASKITQKAVERLDLDRKRLGFLDYVAIREDWKDAAEPGPVLTTLQALYAFLHENRSRLGPDGEGTLVWRPGKGEAVLLCRGPQQQDPIGGRPLRFLPCTDVLDAALSGGIDRTLRRMGFTPNASSGRGLAVVLSVLDRTTYLEDREPVGASLWEEDRARTQVLLGALTYAGLVIGFLATLWAVWKQVRLSRLRADFISSVSHELKTPLTSLLLFSDLLRSGKTEGSEKVREYYRFINEESRKLAHLVGNVLDFARLEEGRKELHKEVLDVGETVRKTAETFQARAEAAGTSIDVSGVNEDCTVAADRNAVERVAANLLDNAVKYGAGGGPVSVSVENSDGAVRLRVADRGPGIPAGQRRRLFRRFERGEHHGSGRPPGSGLGLSIVTDLVVAAHGGRVEVRETPGGGATFVVDFPVTAWRKESHGTDTHR